MWRSLFNVNDNEEENNRRGLDFLRRYDTMFWDSANRRMFLWNEPTPPDDKEASPDGEVFCC